MCESVRKVLRTIFTSPRFPCPWARVRVREPAAPRFWARLPHCVAEAGGFRGMVAVRGASACFMWRRLRGRFSVGRSRMCCGQVVFLFAAGSGVGLARCSQDAQPSPVAPRFGSGRCRSSRTVKPILGSSSVMGPGSRSSAPSAGPSSAWNSASRLEVKGTKRRRRGGRLCSGSSTRHGRLVHQGGGLSRHRPSSASGTPRLRVEV